VKLFRKQVGHDSRLVGSWKVDPGDSTAVAEYGLATIEFRADGSLLYSIDTGHSVQIMRMTWRTEGRQLVTDQPSAPREERTRYKVEGNQLVLWLGGLESRWLHAS
jgi:hypothetical protein